MVAFTSQRHTPASVRLLPDDGNRYECIAGDLLVTPAPGRAHQSVLAWLFKALMEVHGRGAWRVWTSPADLELRGDALVQPDLFVTNLPARHDRTGWTDFTHVELAVEILSPSTARYDRGLKRKFYQGVGTPEYWIVDPDARVVERWRAHDERPEICDGTITWTFDAAVAPVVIDLPALFRRALDE